MFENPLEGLELGDGRKAPKSPTAGTNERVKLRNPLDKIRAPSSESETRFGEESPRRSGVLIALPLSAGR